VKYVVNFKLQFISTKKINERFSLNQIPGKHFASAQFPMFSKITNLYQSVIFSANIYLILVVTERPLSS